MQLKEGVFSPQPYNRSRTRCDLQVIKIGSRTTIKCCHAEDGWWFSTADIWYLLQIKSPEDRHKLHTYLRTHCLSYRFDFGFLHCVMAQPKDFVHIPIVKNLMKYWGVSFANGRITITPVEHKKKNYDTHRRNE